MFVAERDSLRPELALGVAETISVWPKADAENVTVTSATYTARDDSAAQVATGTATITAVQLGARSVSRLDVTLPALTTPREDYILEIVWTDASGRRGSEVVMFDVVRAPLGDLVSLNEVLELQPDLYEDLDRLGQRLSYASGQTAAERAASIYARQARRRLQTKLRALARGEGAIRPYQVLNRRDFAAVEVLYAIVAIYEALGGTSGTLVDEPASERMQHWLQRAETEWSTLKVDHAFPESEDLTKDGTFRPSGVFHYGRA